MKTAVITGANAGIGFCSARQLAEQGLRVVLVCRSHDRAGQARQAIIEATGNPEVYCEIADLSLMRDVKRAADSLVQRFSALDILINNAADFDLSRKTPQFTGEGLEAQFATNTLAPYYLTKLLLPALQQSKDGRVLNISSQGLVVYPNIRLDFGNLGAHEKLREVRCNKAAYDSAAQRRLESLCEEMLKGLE